MKICMLLKFAMPQSVAFYIQLLMTWAFWWKTLHRCIQIYVFMSVNQAVSLYSGLDHMRTPIDNHLKELCFSDPGKKRSLRIFSFFLLLVCFEEAPV